VRRTRPTAPTVTFDTPVALLELLYVREALGLDLAPAVPHVDAPRATLPVPAGAARVWERRFAALIDDGDLAPSGTTGLLTLLGERGAADARAWITSRREQLITSALIPTDRTRHVFRRWHEALQGRGIDRVYVLPVDGPHLSRAGGGVLLVSAATLVDDEAWGAVRTW
jgi:hypothetical protein